MWHFGMVGASAAATVNHDVNLVSYLAMEGARMAGMSWEHASEARAALNAIVTDPDHGVAALSNAQTISNLLKDYLPDAPREKSILVAAAEAGLAETLREHVSQGMDPDTAIRLTASSFSSTTPFTPEACDWVTDEIAMALGISKTPTLANPPPTKPAPGQGFPQSPATGAGGSGQPNPQEQPTAQGYRPGYSPSPQAGFAQPQSPGYPGQRPPPQPYQPAQAQGYPGPQVRPYQAQQPQPYPGQPRPYPAQPGFGQPGTPGGWGPGGYGSGGAFGGPAKQRGGRRGLIVAAVIVALIIAVVVAAALLAERQTPRLQGAGSPTASRTAPPSTPKNSPATTSGVESLATIMHPVGWPPVGSLCTQGGDVAFGFRASTVTSHTFCLETTLSNVVVYGYQFDSYRDYRAGLTHLNSRDHFVKTAKRCPPPAGGASAHGWYAPRNPKYMGRPGQILECFTRAGRPVLIWTMPTMNVLFIATTLVAGDSISRIYSQWWTNLHFG